VKRADPKELLRHALEEIFNQGNLAAADELIDPDYTNHDASPGQGRGPNGVKHVARLYRTAFPDLHLTVERIIVEGDWVSVQVREKGTHRGVFEGIAPTGRHCNWMWIGIYRIAKGKLIERWGRIDTQELYEQLGYRLLTPGA
jgi:predicted ester cyclase